MTLTTDDLDELGPVDWVVVEFPGPGFGEGKVAPHVQDLVDRGLVRILDLVFFRKDAAGSLGMAGAPDLDTSELGALRAAEAELAMVLSEQDVADLAATIEPGHSAAVLV